jgi:hypothetical protein
MGDRSILGCASHATRHTSHVTRHSHTSHATRTSHTSRATRTRHSSLAYLRGSPSPCPTNSPSTMMSMRQLRLLRDGARVQSRMRMVGGGGAVALQGGDEGFGEGSRGWGGGQEENTMGRRWP